MKDMNDYYEEIDLSFEIYEILRKNYWTDWDRIISLVQDIIKNKEKIQMLIESSPVVYGSKFISNDGSAFDIGSVWNITKLSDKTHSARLMFIEEIKKDCKHEPGGKLSKGSLEHVNRGGSVNDLKTFCKHCGVELVAEWREVKK